MNSIWDESVFVDMDRDVYRHRWEGSMHIDRLVGGVPANPKVIEGWIKKNLGVANKQLIQEAIVDTMIKGEKEEHQAVEELIEASKLNRFRSDETGLFVLGANLKACIKESSNISWPKRRGWGDTNKGTRSFFAEHVFVEEKKLYLGLEKPTDIQQRFVSTWRGQSMVYEEFVDDAKIDFTVVSDVDIAEKDWAELWVRAQKEGFGSARSLGYGTFAITKWEKVTTKKVKLERVEPDALTTGDTVETTVETRVEPKKVITRRR